MANLSIFSVIVFLLLKSSKTNALYNFKSEQGNQYYIEIERDFNWYEAVHKCALNNASLVAIESNDEQKEISDILREHFTSDTLSESRFWTAGHDNAVVETFQWISTGRELTFANWAYGEPNNVGRTENCIELRPGDFAWNDAHCSINMGYICEQNPSEQDTNIKCNENVELELKKLKESHEKDLNILLQAQQQQLADKDKEFDDFKKSHHEKLIDVLQTNINELDTVKKFHAQVMDKRDLDTLKKSHETATNLLLEEKETELNALKESSALKLALALDTQQKSCENTTAILVEIKTLELLDQKNQELEDLRVNNEKAKILELEGIRKSHEDEQTRLRQEKEQELEALRIVYEGKFKKLVEEKNLVIATLQKMNELQTNRTNSYNFYNIVFPGKSGNSDDNNIQQIQKGNDQDNLLPK